MGQTAPSLTEDNAPILLSIFPLPPPPANPPHPSTHTASKMPLRYCFPICQKAEHERLKTTEDDRYRYRQRDRPKKPCSHLTSTANRFLLDQNIAWNPFFSFHIQCREVWKKNLVPTLSSPLVALWLKSSGVYTADGVPFWEEVPSLTTDKTAGMSSEGSKCLKVCVCVRTRRSDTCTELQRKESAIPVQDQLGQSHPRMPSLSVR